MKVCYFGPYTEDYPRNLVIRKGLRENGVEVIECYDNSRRIWIRYLRLIFKYLRFRKDYDVIIVPEFGATNVPLARLFTLIQGKPLIFDPFISFYDTEVFDRKSLKEGSFYAKYLHFLDKFSCFLADFIFIHTYAQKVFFQQEFGIREEKFKVVRLGSDNSLFYPKAINRNDKDFLVLSIGSYSPQVGLEYVIEAAKLLQPYPEIKFKLVGKIPEEIIKLGSEFKNISFEDQVPLNKVPDYIAASDICLGIFGNTRKANSIISNRVISILAMSKPLITGDTLAIREIISDRQNALLCPLADSKALAGAILLLRDNRSLAENIADAGYQLYIQNFTPEVIGKQLKIVLEDIINKRNINLLGSIK